MSAYGGRINPGRLFLKRLGLFALFVLMIVAAFGVWGVYQKERESAELREHAELAETDLERREQNLKASIANLNTDRGLEEALREQYALAAEGERLITIVDPPAPKPVEATSSVFDWFKRAFSWR